MMQIDMYVILARACVEGVELKASFYSKLFKYRMSGQNISKVYIFITTAN